MHVLDSRAEDPDPVLRKLVHHDVAGVEVHLHMLALESVDEVCHLLRRHQEAVEENILDVELHAQLLCAGQQLADRVPGPRQAHVVGNRLVVCPPGDADGTRHYEHVLCSQIVRALGDLARQFESAAPLGGIVARERIGPEQERAHAADPDADLLGQRADLGEVIGAVFR